MRLDITKRKKPEVSQLALDTFEAVEPFINIFDCGICYNGSPIHLVSKQDWILHRRYKAGERNLTYPNGTKFNPYLDVVRGIYSPQYVDDHIYYGPISYYTSGRRGFGLLYLDKRLKSGRQFRESVRSITTSRYDRRAKRPKNLRQIHIRLSDLAADGASPSDAVPGWMDYQTWLGKYDHRKRAVAESLAIGSRTGEVAKQFDVSPGRVSQLRREFQHDWEVFQGSK